MLPLTNKLVVSVDLPAPTSGPLLDLAKICLGTNLPFVTRSFGLAKQESDGLYYGLLPYGPRLTKINDTWVQSPFISLDRVAQHHHRPGLGARHARRLRGAVGRDHRLGRPPRLRPALGRLGISAAV